MKKMLLISIIGANLLYGVGDLKEKITDEDATFLDTTYHKIEKKWFNTPSGASISVGTWMINWDQKSTSIDMLTNKNSALDVSYDIKSSLATTRGLKANYRLISAKAEYYSTGITAKDDEEVKGLNIGLSATDLIPYIDTEFRLNSADFKGSIKAKKADGTNVAPSNGIFKTQLNIFDFIIYPFNKYVGFGYRKYKYDFPQDMYLLRNSDNTSISAGLLNIDYDGSFYTINIDNKRYKNNGFIYSLSAGVGTLTPKAKGFEAYIEDSDAKFADAFLGYTSITLNRGIKFSYTVGYKYNKIQTNANKNNKTYTLLTEFNSSFHGPFVQIAFVY